jgi:two-component system NarL family sensor kinase
LENKAQADIVVLIVIGCLGMLILVAFIILFVLYYQKKVLAQQNQLQVTENRYQRQLLTATVQVEEKERERIAKNIHDDVGTMLNVLKMNFAKVMRNAKNEELITNIIKENQLLLDESIQAIRNVIKDLVPPTLLRLGYVKTLEDLCKHISNAGQIEVKYFHNDIKSRLPEQVELQFYRLTQELLNNIIKHSGATEVTIELKPVNAFYNLYIMHNGRGISMQQVDELTKESKGMGLKSIQSRAQLINAKVIYYAPANGPAWISVELVS